MQHAPTSGFATGSSSTSTALSGETMTTVFTVGPKIPVERQATIARGRQPLFPIRALGAREPTRTREGRLAIAAQTEALRIRIRCHETRGAIIGKLLSTVAALAAH